MARPKNDGRGRIGGRAKGSRNKPITPALEWLNNILDKQRPYIETQFIQGVRTKEDAKIYALLSVAAALKENTAAILATRQEKET